MMFLMSPIKRAVSWADENFRIEIGKPPLIQAFLPCRQASALPALPDSLQKAGLPATTYGSL